MTCVGHTLGDAKDTEQRRTRRSWSSMSSSHTVVSALAAALAGDVVKPCVRGYLWHLLPGVLAMRNQSSSHTALRRADLNNHTHVRISTPLVDNTVSHAVQTPDVSLCARIACKLAAFPDCLNSAGTPNILQIVVSAELPRFCRSHEGGTNVAPWFW